MECQMYVYVMAVDDIENVYATHEIISLASYYALHCRFLA